MLRFRHGHVLEVRLSIQMQKEAMLTDACSKPIRRPALKHVLKKFATIPEENESASTRRSNSDEETPDESSPTPTIKPQPIPVINGDQEPTT